IDELHKFSDETLNDVRNALDDRLKGILMQYSPTTIWRRGDKDKAAAMIQAIKKKALYGLKQAPRTWYDMLSSFLLS
nr:hypothetical protein [Tanacetum cinerariifolium]